MKSKTLILLYNPETKEYVESLSHECDISWSDLWIGAYDFSNMFFLKRLYFKIKLSKKVSVNLIWKKILPFEKSKGLI